MAQIDHVLIYEACKAINGANAHAINTCLHQYEKAKNAKTRKRYELTLRQFVAESRRRAAICAEAEVLRGLSQQLIERSEVLRKTIDQLPFTKLRM